MSYHVLVTDFDGTCTEVDTTGLIPHLAARKAAVPFSVLERWTEFENRYISLLKRCKEEVLPEASSKGSGVYDAAGLNTALRALDGVSDVVTAEVSESGILAGIETGSVAEAIAEWSAAPDCAPVNVPALRPGCAATLSAAAASGWQLGVLSLNWCPPLIRALLPIIGSNGATIWSNQIDVATGRISSDVSDAAAKVRVIRSLINGGLTRAELPDGNSHGAGELESLRGCVVYVGDSATDLPAMLEADVGILIGESESTRELARRYGLRLEPLHPALPPLPRNPEGVVWEVSRWEDVRRGLGIAEEA
jgi:phosphoserine phosphatase